MRIFRNSWRIVLLAFLVGSCTPKTNEEPIKQVVDEALDFSFEQSMLMAQQFIDREGELPRTFEDSVVKGVKSHDWTSGFFPGLLWYLYEDSADDQMLQYARTFTRRVEAEQYTTDNHDIGFILTCSFGNGLRLNAEDDYSGILLNGARSLTTRFKPEVGLIRSWDWNRSRWQYPVIIDNMMNLELLMWAYKNSGDTLFKQIAVSHADKTMANHYRPDYSCYHVVSYDTLTGQPHVKETFQGYADHSAWARGQAWGLYGYTMMYRETGDTRYRDQAQNIAAFLINHPNMPADYIPYWDFDVPEIPDVPRDASAAAVMASALIELSGYVSPELNKEYLRVAEAQIRSLASESYRANPGENGFFILKHSVGFLPKNSEVDVPLNYADYYFVEALVRYKKLLATAQ